MDVDLNQPRQLQKVAQEVINSVTVDAKNQIIIDTCKLNPDALKITGGKGVVTEK